MGSPVTMLSQLVDSVLVVLVLFTGVWGAEQMIEVILDLWLFKLLVALVDTPFAYLGVGVWKRWAVRPL